MSGIFLFLTYHLQQTLGYSPVITGVAFLPMIAGAAVSATLSNGRLLPRLGPKPLALTGTVLEAAGLLWLTRIRVQSSYPSAVSARC